MKQFILIIFLMLSTKFSYSQIVDRFGVNVGMSYATQLWDYKLMSIEPAEDYKLGLMTFLSAEKDFGQFLTLRTEIGYIQKGFKFTNELTFPNSNPILVPAKIDNRNVILHDLAINLGLKISPFNFNCSPYVFFGVRGDYLMSYKDVVVEEPGSGKRFLLFRSYIEDFRKFNLGVLCVIGIDINKLFYFEIEYNPNLTKNLDDIGLGIKDNCWGIKLGVNINRLIKKKHVCNSLTLARSNICPNKITRIQALRKFPDILSN